MKRWNVYKNSYGEIKVVKEGFNWWAFFFVGLWAISKGLVWAGATGLALTIAANRMPEGADIFAIVIIITLMLVYGFNGNSWVAAKYERQKYSFLQQVNAASAEGAKAMARN